MSVWFTCLLMSKYITSTMFELSNTFINVVCSVSDILARLPFVIFLLQ